jgi:hypothetical protein
MYLLTLLISWTIVSTGSLAAPLPQPFTAKYQGNKRVLIFNVSATSEIQLSHSNKYIKYTSRSKISWSLFKRKFLDCSIIRINDGLMYPLEYQHIDKSNDKSNVMVTFDWENKRATTIRGDKSNPIVVNISWPTWDPMSLQLAIITAAPNQAPGSNQALQVLEKGKLLQYNLDFIGEVETDTTLPGIKVFEVLSKKNNGGGTLWLAPDFHWTPVKIRIDDVYLNLQALPTFEQADTDDADEIPQC